MSDSDRIFRHCYVCRKEQHAIFNVPFVDEGGKEYVICMPCLDLFGKVIEYKYGKDMRRFEENLKRYKLARNTLNQVQRPKEDN